MKKIKRRDFLKLIGAAIPAVIVPQMLAKEKPLSEGLVRAWDGNGCELIPEGKIEGIATYNRALTKEEIKQLYVDGKLRSYEITNA